jgi:hypothetical protein
MILFTWVFSCHLKWEKFEMLSFMLFAFCFLSPLTFLMFSSVDVKSKSYDRFVQTVFLNYLLNVYVFEESYELFSPQYVQHLMWPLIPRLFYFILCGLKIYISDLKTDREKSQLFFHFVICAKT